MTAYIPINSKFDEVLGVRSAEAYAWRGRCINLFARGEKEITLALEKLNDSQAMPMLVSQKAKRLEQTLPSGSKLQTCLKEFQALLKERTSLTHGCGRLFVDRGGWIISLDHVSKRGPVQLRLTKSEAAEFQRILQSTVQKIESCLRKP